MAKKKEKPEYRIEATCFICGKPYKARYNMGERAKTCTSSLQPDHVCQRKTVKIPGRRDKLISCVQGCCRSKYARGATSSIVGSSIDSRKFLDKDEYKKTLVEIRKLDNPKRITILFILETGCRCGEALLVRNAYLEWKDGAFSNVRMPTLKKQGHPLLPVRLDNKSELVRELKAWTKKMGPNELVFKIAKRTLQRTFERILDKVKPERTGLVHLMRHTRATRLIDAGLNFNEVRKQLRWSSIELAKIYVHTEEDAVSDAFDKMR